jgi:hypothetical protein
MKHLLPIVILGSIAFAGCQTSHTQDQIEGNIRFAVIEGQSAENIKQLVLQADDPSHAAVVAVWQIMDLEHLPTQMQMNWSHYCQTEPSSTPSVKIYEIINRYKISVLRVLVPFGVDLNHHYRAAKPPIFWAGVWGHPPITPQLLEFLLEHGYDPDANGRSPSALGFCAQPGESFLRYDHKYRMINALLKHGANPNVTSMGLPILHQLILYHRENPHQIEIMRLLANAGADVNVVDRQTKTALDLAIAYKDSGANDAQAQKIIDLLRRFGAKRADDL